MTLYIENVKKNQQKILDLINSKLQNTKAKHIHKKINYTTNEQPESELKKNNSIYGNIKKLKYLEII